MNDTVFRHWGQEILKYIFKITYDRTAVLSFMDNSKGTKVTSGPTYEGCSKSLAQHTLAQKWCTQLTHHKCQYVKSYKQNV